MELALRGWPTNVKKNRSCLVGPVPSSLTPFRREFISPTEKGSCSSALPVLLIDAFLQCVPLMKLLCASGVWWGRGCWHLGCLGRHFTLSTLLAHGRLIRGWCRGWRTAGAENEQKEDTTQCVRHHHRLTVHVRFRSIATSTRTSKPPLERPSSSVSRDAERPRSRTSEGRTRCVRAHGVCRGCSMSFMCVAAGGGHQVAAAAIKHAMAVDVLERVERLTDGGLFVGDAQCC